MDVEVRDARRYLLQKLLSRIGYSVNSKEHYVLKEARDNLVARYNETVEPTKAPGRNNIRVGSFCGCTRWDWQVTRRVSF